MCGIISTISIKPDRKDTADIEAMLASLSKRGPDDKATVRIDSTTTAHLRCTFGQTRLSILDIEGGKQPMRDNTLPLTVVFNGEIYNYKELRTELEKAGHRFSTKSDTEAILKAYAEWGKDAPKHLDGMFAFALWDERTDSLFMARDRFGKKPLYYAWEGPEKTSTFMLASEIKALFASGKIKGRIDPQALDTYLSLMYIPADRSVYSNIHQLPPCSRSHVQPRFRPHRVAVLDA